MARHRRDEEEPNSDRPPGARVGGRRRTIQGQLARILALPLVAVVVLLVIVVTNDLNSFRTATATARAVGLTLEVRNLTQELQNERGLASNVLGGDVSFSPELPRARGLVNAELRKVAELADGSGAEALATKAALGRLDGLETVRAQIDAGQISREEASSYFTERIAALDGIEFGLDRSADLTLRRGVSALEALGEAKEMTSRERAFLGGVFAAGGFTGVEYRQFAAIHAQQQAAIDRFHRFATPAQSDQLFRALDSGAAGEAAFFEERAMQAVERPFVVSPQSWWSAHTTIIDDMRAVQEAVGADIAHRAGQLRRDSALRLAGLAGLTLLSGFGAVVVVVAASRSITRPLATLAAEARAVASRRLPDAVTQVQSADPGQALDPPVKVAVPPRSSAEIVAVAEALDSAQATAYSLAAEQAMLRRSTTESLANLGRRNQNLLRRQLGFITQLERDEIDPAGLANLFELDHLATRMRRNAESLLVLVGESAPRTWSEPMPVSDVLRAAISEVEDYRRVTLRRIDDGFVGGAFVAGLAHMIAELVENGLAFSPPDTEVEIQGRALAGRYLIGITDQGIGMDPDDLARANGRLRGEDSFLTAPTRYLGHYVVGRLARRMGVHVEIGRSPVTGVTARVSLPANVLIARAVVTGTLVSHHAPPSATPAISATAAAATANGAETAKAETTPDAAQKPTAGTLAAQAVAHGDGERTRNGLVMRVPRGRLVTPAPEPPAIKAAPTAATPPAAPASPEPAPRPKRAKAAAVAATVGPSTVENGHRDGPAEAAAVAARMTTLRAGFARGEGNRNERANTEPAEPADNAGNAVNGRKKRSPRGR